MNRPRRLNSARKWLAEQGDRPPERLLRSYCKWYGVDWECALVELTMLGLVFDPKWVEKRTRAHESELAARAKRKATKAAAVEGSPWSDGTFAYIAGYTEGGYPYGLTWDEWSRSEQDGLLESSGIDADADGWIEEEEALPDPDLAPPWYDEMCDALVPGECLELPKEETLPHLFFEYENHPLWLPVESAIEDLVQNSDLMELTEREYIIGYIVQELVKHTDGQGRDHRR